MSLSALIRSPRLFGLCRQRSEDRLPLGFTFRLELEDGRPADPPRLTTADYNWNAGGTIPLGHKTLRVVDVRDDDADQPPTLVVEAVVPER